MSYMLWVLASGLMTIDLILEIKKTRFHRYWFLWAAAFAWLAVAMREESFWGLFAFVMGIACLVEGTATYRIFYPLPEKDEE